MIDFQLKHNILSVGLLPVTAGFGLRGLAQALKIKSGIVWQVVRINKMGKPVRYQAVYFRQDLGLLSLLFFPEAGQPGFYPCHQEAVTLLRIYPERGCLFNRNSQNQLTLESTEKMRPFNG